MSLKAARSYKKYGFSIIATDEHKRAIVKWDVYQKAIATDEQLDRMFVNAKGLAVICGNVSGGLEVIDIDCKYDTTGTLFEDYMQLVVDASQGLAEKLLIAKTTNGGYHIYYRCETIAGNQKLASRPSTKEEIEDNPHNKVMVLIETRGEGGYVIAWPSPGYQFIQGKVSECPQITLDERACLLEIARSMNQYVEVPITHIPQDSKSFTESPFEAYNRTGDMSALLQKHGWTVVKETGEKIIFKRPGKTDSKTSGDYNKKLGWFSVFTTSSQFEPNKAYRPYAVYTVLECGGDFSRASKQLLKDGYGHLRKKIDRKYETFIRKQKTNDTQDDAIVNQLHTHFEIPKEQAEEIIKNFNANAGQQIRSFWEVNPENMKISVIRNKLERFLTERGGFSLYFYDNKSKIFKVIKDDNGLIEEASTEQIKKFIKNYIVSLPGSFDDITREDLLEVIYRGGQTFFSESFFEFLEPVEIDFLKDTSEVAYFPFKNGVVCVDKDGANIKSYGELKKSIWSTQVIDFSIEIFDTMVSEVEFFHFISKICNDDPVRIEYCCALVGYMLHKFKDPAKPYSIIFCEETDDDKHGGGAGKGIMVKAISKLVNTEEVDGKNFKHDKNFLWQRVKLDTKMIAIQDVRKNVDFEGFNSMITEGFTIEKKNKDEIYIPYTDAPKIVFTTNFTIPANSNHAKRRQKTLEFSQFFNPGKTPLDHFGHKLFDDWDNDQWTRFYNFMFRCVKDYLRYGIPNIESSVTIKAKQTKNMFGDEFFEWFEEYSTNGCADFKMFHDLYNDFLKVNEYDKKDFSQKKFKKGLEDTANLYEKVIISKKNRMLSNKTEVKMTENGSKSDNQVQSGAIRCKSGEEEMPF